MGVGYVAAGIKGKSLLQIDLNGTPSSGLENKKKKNSTLTNGAEAESPDVPSQLGDTVAPKPAEKKKKKKRGKKSSSSSSSLPITEDQEDDQEESPKKSTPDEATAPEKKRKKERKTREKIPRKIEEYIFDPSLPTGYARGLIAGSRFSELVGSVKFCCPQTKYEINIEFQKAVTDTPLPSSPCPSSVISLTKEMYIALSL